MPWVEELLRHDRFLDDLFYKVFRKFKDNEGNYWWQDFNDKVPKVDLYKITFEKGLLVRDGQGYTVPTVPKEGNMCITRHMIMRRWDGEYLAFAQSTGSFKINTEGLPTTQGELANHFMNLYKEFVNYTTLYAYTMDEYEAYTHYIDNQGNVLPVVVMCDDGGYGVLRSSLDVEYYSEDVYYKDMKQSPIIVLDMLRESGEMVASIGKLNYRTNTNWWDDSLIQLRGVIDETSCFFTLKIDTAPVWEDNIVVSVPFFFGNLIVKDVPDTERHLTPIALFGGTQYDKFLDLDNSVVSIAEVLQPITRNYVYHPSNGVDSIMVKKTKYGARYQAHYLSWKTPPNSMPPKREVVRNEEDKARKYPRAWNYLRKGYYNYTFHPSRYDETVHTSRAYVVHPEDGIIGYIPNIVVLPVINVMEGEKLKYPIICN